MPMKLKMKGCHLASAKNNIYVWFVNLVKFIRFQSIFIKHYIVYILKSPFARIVNIENKILS